MHNNFNSMRKKLANYCKKNQYDKAVTLSKEILKFYQLKQDNISMDYANDLFNLAIAFEQRGNFHRATELYEESSRVVNTHFGENEAYADRLNNLAGAYNKMGDYESGLKAVTKSAEIYEKISQYGPGHLLSIYNMGNTYAELGMYADAVETLELAKTKTKTKTHMDFVDICISLAYVYYSMGDFKRAVLNCTLGLDEQRKITPIDVNELLRTVYFLAQVYEKNESLDLAMHFYEEAYTLLKAVVGKSHQHTISCENRISNLCKKLDNPQKALEYKLLTLTHMKSNFGESYVQYAFCLRDAAMLHYAQKDYENAEKLLLKCIRLEKKLLGNDSEDFITDSLTLISIYIEQNKIYNATSLLLDTIGHLSDGLSNYDEYFHKLSGLYQSLYDLSKFYFGNRI